MRVIQSATGYFAPAAQPFELYEEPEQTWTIAATMQLTETTRGFHLVTFPGVGSIKAESL